MPDRHFDFPLSKQTDIWHVGRRVCRINLLVPRAGTDMPPAPCGDTDMPPAHPIPSRSCSGPRPEVALREIGHKGYLAQARRSACGRANVHHGGDEVLRGWLTYYSLLESFQLPQGRQNPNHSCHHCCQCGQQLQSGTGVLLLGC